MKRKITFLSAALMLLAFLSVPMGMWGQTTEFEFNLNQLYQNGTLITAKTVITTSGGTLTFTDQDENFTILLTRNSGNQPGFYTSSGYIRFYNNDTFKLSAADGFTLTQVVITPNGSNFNLSSMEGLNTTTRTWTGSASEITFTGSGTNKWDKLTITYTTGGSQTTYYTVTYHANVTGVDDEEDTYAEGTTVTLRPANTFTNEGYTFSEWNTQADGDGDGYAAGDQIEGIDDDLEFYAIWTENTPSDEQWVLTNLADLTANDVFVIVGNNGSNYAMANDNGTSSAPAAVAVTVANNVISGTVAENIQWNITGNATDGYTFYPNGTTETWLYCTNTNNGVRVGTNISKTFKIDSNSGYLKHDGTSRFVGIYNSSDWRCYTSSGGNIANQTFAFYKKVTSGVVPPSISANDVNIAYDATNGSIAYTINNEPSPAGTLTAAVTDGNWLTLGQGTTSPIEFTCSANENTNARTATVTLTYTYGDNQTATKDVTVTQAAAPVIYDNIEDLFNAATSTATDVTVSFESWFVTGVSTTGTNVFVTDGTNGFVIYDNGGNLGDTYHANDLIEGVTTASLVLYKGFAELTNVDATNLTITSYEAPTFANVAMADLAGVNTGALVHYDNLTCSVDNNKYYLSDGTTTLQVYNSLYEFEALEDGKTYNLTGIYQQYNSTKEVLPRSADDIEEVTAPAEPSITITPDVVNLDAEQHYMNLLDLAYENIEVEGPSSFTVHYYNAEGEEIELVQGEAWLVAGVVLEDDVYQVLFAVVANYGEARTAYFKVSCGETYSNLVTVTQAAPVLDYAVLPFVWEGGERSAFEALNGTSTYGVGDYAATQGVYRMKLDSDGDYIMVKTDGQPGLVTIGVKMIGGGNTSTITIQGSADGETFTDIEELTISGAQNDTLTLETTNAFDANDRYVRMLFTRGSNVGVGPISIAKGTAPSINVAPDTFDLEAVGELNGMHVASGFVTYNNIDITQASDFHIQFYNAEGVEQEQPGWILGAAVSQIANSYQVACMVEQNTGAARSTYYKVYAFDADSNPVYSNLVTINQAGVPQQYTLTVEPFENLGLITFVNDVMAMEADGTLQVNQGDQIMLSVVADEGYVMESLIVDGVEHVNDIETDYTYSFEISDHDITITATAVEEVVPSPSIWVLTDLADLTEDDIFVIVGTDEDDNTYALPNDVTGNNAPSAVSITVVDGTLSDEPAANYQWNMSGNATNGYTFYVNGDHDNWLYCNTNNASGSNNNMRIGPGGNVNRNLFVLDDDGYLVTTDDKVDRYLSIYFNSGVAQDWRGYINTNSAVAISFYKKVEVPATETYTLDVAGYTEGAEGGYVLIASPVTVDPENVEGMTDGTFDLYYFNQAEDQEWRNYEASHFNLVPGKGYLYAKQATTDGEIFHFELTGTPYNGNGQITLEKTTDAEFEGWNLIGNPFGNAATIDKAYYRLNADGSEVNSETESSAVAVMEGVFVIADTDGETVTFTEQTNPGNSNGISQFSINVSMNRGESIDRAIVRFDNGSQLPKFQLNPNHTKVYIPQGENDYAIVRSANEGEMPVSFKAENNGSYTFSINAENMEMNYLHLIDNMTGADVDMLATPSYSFEAKTTDYANRFRLVFSGNTVNENGNETFAYYNGSEWVISNMGEATLQVVDMLGRIVSSETVNGNATMSTANLGAGVYVIRLVNGENVMTQKIVVR